MAEAVLKVFRGDAKEGRFRNFECHWTQAWWFSMPSIKSRRAGQRPRLSLELQSRQMRLLLAPRSMACRG